MPEFELLVIGGGPAGLSAARGYRAGGGAGHVAIVTDEQRMPYRRPPLTKELLRGEIAESELLLEPESWLREQRVSLISGRAVAVDPIAHVVALSGGRELSYRSCVLATGAEPTRLPIPGSDDPAVRVLRSLDHVRELQARLTRDSQVVVIGSGFIGCEIAASLRKRRVPVSLVAQDPLPNAARLGDDAGAEIARWLRHSGVSLNLNFAVQAIERRDEELLVHGDGMSVTGTLVVMATGVAPRSELLAGTGVRLAHGAVPADETMRSELPDVLVAGDVGYAFNSGAGRPLRVEHWGDALAQGELAGRGAAGERVTWDQVPGFWSEIGGHTLKYAAWGDGYEESRFESRTDGGFVVRYGRDGLLVGVLTHQADDEYERGQRMIRERTRWS